MTHLHGYTAFEAFEKQLRTLCLDEFPCGNGSWRESCGKKRKLLELDKVKSRYAITLRDYGALNEKTETLEELVTNTESPWNLDYSWSNEAKDLREIAVRSPWLIDNKYVYSHFKTLKIVDKQVTVVTEEFLKFENLQELTLSANLLETVNSRCLPKKLSVLELCANKINGLEDLCDRPPPLTHLGLGYNNIPSIDDYMTGNNWPKLLSLDLSHNDLTDLMEVTRKFQSLPKLRNLVLYGNPLALIPGYRGYTIDTLRNLSILDDISISADERHRYKRLAKRKEYILDEAKVTLHVTYIKGIPMPEEIKNPADQPEYPVVTRKYSIQFMYLEDKSANAEIFQIMHDDDFSSMASPTIETMTGRSQHSQVAATEIMTTNSLMDDQATNVDDQQNMETDQEDQNTLLETERDSQKTPEKEELDDAKKKVSPINSDSSTWAEHIDLNWSQVLVRDDLLGLRNFFKEPMEVRLVEEKILAYPPDQLPNASPPPPAPSEPGKSKKDKKEEKPAAKKGNEKDDKKKKGKKEEIELVAMPSEFTTLATFPADLSHFLDNDQEYEETFSQEWAFNPPEHAESLEVEAKKELNKKSEKKDKGKPASAKSQKKEKEKDSTKSAKQGGKEKVSPDKVNKTASKNVAMETGEDEAPPLPPLEFQIKVELHHWKTAMDSNKEDGRDYEAA